MYLLLLVLYAFVNVVLKVCQQKFSIGNLEYALLLQSIATNYFPVNVFQMTVVQLALWIIMKSQMPYRSQCIQAQRDL